MIYTAHDEFFEIENNILSRFSGEKKNIFIPLGVSTIGQEVFSQSSIESLVIPNSVTKINEGAFNNCSSLSEISIPYSLNQVERLAFVNCDSLRTIHITDIESWCNIDFGTATSNPLFYANALCLNGENITKLDIPENIKAIKDFAFDRFFSLEEITLPSTLTSIGYCSFYACISLKTITIPSKVKAIGSRAFESCNALSEVFIDGDLDSVGDFIFHSCTNLKKIHVRSNDVKEDLIKTNSVPNGCFVVVDNENNTDIEEANKTHLFDKFSQFLIDELSMRTEDDSIDDKKFFDDFLSFIKRDIMYSKDYDEL